MEKYNIFSLLVVEKDGYNFICEMLSNIEFREVLTKEILTPEEVTKERSLFRYYSILELGTYKNGQILNPLMLTEKDILLKYIELNQKEKTNININDYLKRQQEELKGWEILKKECPQFAKQLASETLQGLGIIDKNENLIGPYKEVFTKRTDMDIMIDNWRSYVEAVKDDIPDIPIINIKELQKTLDKK